MCPLFYLLGANAFATNADSLPADVGADYWPQYVFVVVLILIIGHLTFFLSLSSCIVDEMGSRIDELEKSIGELMSQAGIDDAGAAATPAGK
jgi:hypothetical protein